MVLFIAAPLLAWLAYGAQRFDALREGSELRLNRTLRIAQEHALKVLQTNEIILDQAIAAQGLDDEAALRARAQSLHAQLGALSRNQAQTEFIWIWSASGRPLVNNRLYPVPEALDVSDRDYFVHHLRTRGELYFRAGHGWQAWAREARDARRGGRAPGANRLKDKARRYIGPGDEKVFSKYCIFIQLNENHPPDDAARQTGERLRPVRRYLLPPSDRARQPWRDAADGPVLLRRMRAGVWAARGVAARWQSGAE